MNDQTSPFSFIEITAQRTRDKPRRRGVTLMTDWGLGLARVQDLLETAGGFLDYAKLAAGTSRLYDEKLLGRKLELYVSRGVVPYLGGQFQEYVFAHYGKRELRRFLAEARRLGFAAAEVSDNYVTLTQDERRHQIELLVESGFAAFGEVGSKTAKNEPATLIAQVRDVLSAGAEMALVEGAEFIDGGRFRTDLVDAIRSEIDVDRIMFELPTVRVGASPNQIHDVKKHLVRKIGPDVNLANVVPDDIFETEALRTGFGVVGPSGRSRIAPDA